MKFAWVENNIIRDIAPGTPSEFYHPDVAALYATEVPDDAANDDGWVNGQLVKPEPSPEPAPAPRTWTVDNVRPNLTLAEKVKWDNNATNEVVTAKQELATPKEVAYTTEVLDMLVGAGVISQASADKILE